MSKLDHSRSSVQCPLGEIGKHDRLKICSYWVAGSSPAAGKKVRYRLYQKNDANLSHIINLCKIKCRAH